MRSSATSMGQSVCDVGCGTGHLLRLIRDAHGSKLDRYVGVDFIIPEHFRDDSFRSRRSADRKASISGSHVRHGSSVHSCAGAYSRLSCRNLRAEADHAESALLLSFRVNGRGIYTFNPHFNFFLYAHSFLRAIIPLPSEFVCNVPQLVETFIIYGEDHSLTKQAR